MAIKVDDAEATYTLGHNLNAVKAAYRKSLEGYHSLLTKHNDLAKHVAKSAEQEEERVNKAVAERTEQEVAAKLAEAMP